MARVTIWWTILRICIEERLVYRADFALGTLMRFLPIVTQVFLWGAIFSANGDTRIAGKYDFADMIAYYLLTMVGRAFSSMPGLASGIALDVREGTIKKYLTQPIDMVGFLLLNRMAHKLVYYSVAIFPFALVFWLCRGYFVGGWPEPMVVVAFVATLMMGFLLGFFLEAAIGMIGFWFLEVSSLLFVYMLFNFFCSGHMFPIDILPEYGRQFIELLPLPYLAYYPAAIFLGKVPVDEIPFRLAVQAGWLLFFVAFCYFMFRRGVKRYSGFGG